VPVELCELVDRLLSKNPDDRPASMDLVAQSLETFCSSSDLAEQVKEAVTRREKLDRSPVARVPPNEFGQTAGAAAAQAAPAQPARGKRVLGWVAACLCLFAAAAMGVVMTLQTTAGQLVIETATPDVEVRVVKAGQPYRQLTLKQQANSLRLGAGEYEVEIISDADGLEIENGTFTLKRGETWLAKIVHRGDTNEGGRPAVNQPTYEGKTLAEWISLLRRERSAKQLFEACRALDKLATGDDTAEAIAALLVAVRVHKSDDNYQTESNSRGIRVWDTVRFVLEHREQSAVVAALTNELAHPEEANAGFILEYLSRTYPVAGSPVNEQLLKQVEQLTADGDPVIRMQALSSLRKIGSPETATRRLVAALSDSDVDVQLFAARALVEMQSNSPLVVAALGKILGSGELRQRAEAAWMLGDLGRDSKPALPELTAIVEDEDDVISRAAAFQIPRKQDAGGHSTRGMTSVKDAAIRALVEIGDASVVPVLMVEWDRRPTGSSQPKTSTAAWNEVPSRTVANSYNDTWVADAIEQLIHIRPQHTQTSQGTVTLWSFRNLLIDSAYSIAFDKRQHSSWEFVLDAATQLLPRAQDFEKEQARKVIRGGHTLPKAAELALEIKLIELLATADHPHLVLESMIIRWGRYGALGADDPTRGDQVAALQAYRECAVRIVRATSDWKATLVPHLFRLADDGHWSAGIVLIDILPELEPQQQVDSTVRVFQLIAVRGNEHFATSLNQIAGWLNDGSHRAAIQQQLEQATGNTWEDLMVGLLRSGLADDVVKQTLKTRFGDDSINRSHVLEKLINSLDDQPDLAQVMIDLFDNPALDAAATAMRQNGQVLETSFRAVYLKKLSVVSARHRPSFMPLLNKLAQSGKNGELQAARQVLDAWN
jgi:HEAT repeat protein